MQACERCGQQHLTKLGQPSCGAHSKRTGQPCGTAPMIGTERCRMHAGKKAAPIVAEQRARAAVATFGLPIQTSPAEALLDEVHRTAGHVAWLAERVADLEEHDVVWGTTRIKTGGDDYGTTEAAEPNAWLKLYQEERKHLVRVCAEAIRCGIEERRVKLAESQGAMVAGLIRSILSDLNLTAEQLALVSEVVPRRLRELAA